MKKFGFLIPHFVFIAPQFLDSLLIPFDLPVCYFGFNFHFIIDWFVILYSAVFTFQKYFVYYYKEAALSLLHYCRYLIYCLFITIEFVSSPLLLDQFVLNMNEMIFGQKSILI